MLQYTRTAEREADLIRPMPILQKTMDYLLDLLDQPYDDSFLGLYNFLWDRMRAIRMDLRMQHIFNLEAIRMLEQMVCSLSACLSKQKYYFLKCHHSSCVMKAHEIGWWLMHNYPFIQYLVSLLHWMKKMGTLIFYFLFFIIICFIYMNWFLSFKSLVSSYFL